MDEARVHGHLEVLGLDRISNRRAALFQAFDRDLPQLLANLRVVFEQQLEILTRQLD